MGEEILTSQVRVHKAGYRWIQAATSHRLARDKSSLLWFLTDGQRPHGALTGDNYTEYDPLDPTLLYSGLFRVFADTEPNKKGILAFAGKYGMLGQPISQLIYRPDGNELPDAYGECIEDWLWEIEEMRGVIAITEKLRVGNLDGLFAHFSDFEGEISYHTSPGADDGFVRYGRSVSFRFPTSAVKGDANFLPDLYAFSRFDDPARLVSVIVPWAVNRHLVNRMSARLSTKAARSGFHLQFGATDLLSAMWFQFAQAVTINKDFRQCHQCGIWFESGPEAARASRLFCTDACRFKAYRGRQAEARRLYAGGMAVEQIAKQLETDIETARGWALAPPRRNKANTKKGEG